MTPTVFRHRLRAAGFDPLPLIGKRPVLMKWQQRTDTSEGDIDLWGKLYPDAANTGALCRLMPTLDVDIHDPEAATAIENLVRERFEERGLVLVRFGAAPKRAIPFRTQAPFGKITANLIGRDGSEAEKLELLCDGQQIVVAGVHPVTKKDYAWFGGELGKIKLADLPYLHPEEACALVNDAVELLVREHGFARPKAKGSTTGNGFDHDPATWTDLFGNIAAGRDLHESIRDLAAKLIAGGLAGGATVNAIRAALECSTAPRDARFAERMDDVARAVRTAEDKYAATHTTPLLPSEPLLWPYPGRAFAAIPRRRWLHAGHYIREQIVMTVAPGGYGKTTLILCNALEMTTGRGLIGPPPSGGPLHVAYWNAEDPDDEIERRIAAACLRHDVDPIALRDRLFLGSRLTGGRRIASLDRSGNVVFDGPMVIEIERLIGELKLDCVIFDPLVAFHRIPEADNMLMEQVIKDGFGAIAARAGCCIELSQHTRKPSSGQHGALTADDSRGAGAIVNAARSVRVLNRMTAEEAELPKIEPEERRHYLRISRDKTNLAPPGKATWVHLVSVALPNGDGAPGDQVQAAETWDYPQPFDNVTADDMRWVRDIARERAHRADPRSPDWIGRPLAERLELDPDDRGDRKRLNAILKTWITTGVLAIEARKDEARRTRYFVVPGDWQGDS